MSFCFLAQDLLACLPLFCAGDSSLYSVSPHEVEKRIAALPGYAKFGLFRPAYWNGRLFACCNVGLLEFFEDKLVALWQASEGDAAVDGPWLSPGSESLWVLSQANHSFYKLDKGNSAWISVSPPKTEKGYYTRGEWLEGFTLMDGAAQFSLVAAGSAWEWDVSKEKFVTRRLPGISAVAAAAATAKSEFFVERKDALAIGDDPIESDVIKFVRGGAAKEPVSRLGKYHRYSEFYVAQMLPDGDGVWLRTKEGDLLWADEKELRLEQTPGDCEHLARSSQGVVLASFAERGIFERVGGWKKILDHPYAEKKGPYWAFLAESRGQIAFVATPMPVMERGEDESLRAIKWMYPGPQGMWVARQGQWKALMLGEKFQSGVIPR